VCPNRAAPRAPPTFDFNRLRRVGIGNAVPIVASIFLDILNVFLLLLQLFDGERS
jgi:FtsH-binding integral membrane protein